MRRKSIYSDEYFDPNDALWPEKWRGTEEGLMVYLDVYNLRAETIKAESEYNKGVENDRVIVFKIKNSDIIRIIRCSNLLWYAKECDVNIFNPINETDAHLREDLIIRVSYNSIEFLMK